LQEFEISLDKHPMALIVQKYGGTSVKDAERIRNVAARIGRSKAEGNRLIVVVSAMGGVTDSLLKLAREVSPQPSERELDMLLATGEQTTIALTAMALHALNIPAISLTGAQAGIVTDGIHTKAKIANITPDALTKILNEGKVAIVAGFQGQTMEGQITTLGRGGSDLTAIALAAVMKADLCQIYTDVDGVYTADPRVVPAAHKIQEISYDEMLEMASLGSKVMQSRSVEFAKKFGVIFEVRSSMNDNPGTIVKEETKSMEEVVVRGVSLDKNQAKVTISGVPDRPGMASKLFGAIAEANLNVDMIVQNVSHSEEGSPSGTTDITFTVARDELQKVRGILNAFRAETLAREITLTEGIAKLSVVGIGMRSHSGVAAALFAAMAEKGINIQMISTSEIKISIVMDEDRAAEAMRAAHDAFHLEGGYPSASTNELTKKI
jgi:aspartate kinase